MLLFYIRLQRVGLACLDSPALDQQQGLQGDLLFTSRDAKEARKRAGCFLYSMGSLVDGVFNNLDKDLIISVLSRLDTPSDLARAACVCCSWRKYVVEGELWKKMCILFFPAVGNKFKCLSGDDSVQGELCGYNHFNILELQSSSYNLLLRRLLSPPLQRTCIAEPLHASTTDNLPRESIAQTLYPEPEYSVDEHSYWSSEGEASTSGPEMLTYRLVSDVCVVHDVKVQPFRASFQHGNPIYSSRMVRFRFGYSRSSKPHWSGLLQCLKERPTKATTDDYVWTYVSPAFPMEQEDTLQTFRLPKPTLCIGGILQVEFMGRVQTQSTDSLYYICICHVYVTGRPILDFKLEHIDDKGQVVLRHLNAKVKPSRLNQSFSSRINRSDLIRGSIVDMLLLYLLEAKLLDELEEE